MENLLAKTIIEATKVNQTDIALERMTNIAVRKNLNAQQNLVRSQTSRINSLINDFEDLNHGAKNKDLEIRQLQEKLKIAMNMYEEANDNTGAWIELLNKPLHVIATKHEGFNNSFQEVLGKLAEIVLENMVQAETIDFMGEQLEYGPLEIDVIKNKFEGMILDDATKESTEPKTNNQKIITDFSETLNEKHNNDKKKLKKKIIKSGKNYTL